MYLTQPHKHRGDKKPPPQPHIHTEGPVKPGHMRRNNDTSDKTSTLEWNTEEKQTIASEECARPGHASPRHQTNSES